METRTGVLCIVVIDDDDAILTLMRQILDDEGYSVILGSTAHEAVPLIRAARPALIILDLVMQTQEAGLDILHELRATPVVADTPVLLMTAQQRFVQDHGEEMRQSGVAVMAKPFDVEALVARVASLVRDALDE